MEPKEILKNARTKKGITQEQIAGILNVELRTYQRYEEGKFPKFKNDKIKLIDEELETNLYDILYDKKVSPKNDLYTKLLEDNDRFFKNEYAQMLISLNKLIDQGKRSEALIKLNLEHTGNVEAHQLGVEPEVIHEQINNRIVEMGSSGEMGTGVDT